MRWILVVVAISLAACDDHGKSPKLDAGSPHDDGGVPDGPTTDFFGESCTEAAFPAVTVCHLDLGWCISGTCRPMCSRGCPPGTTHISDRGACYCAP